MKFKNKNQGAVDNLIFTLQGVLVEYWGGKSSDCIGYMSIESLNTNVIVETYTHKGTTRPYIADIEITLKSVDGQEFVINISGSLRNLYKVIDIRKYVKNFTLNIDGADNFDTAIKIYSKFGVKFPFPDKSNLINIELAATILFGLGTYMVFEFYRNFETFWAGLLIFFAVSTILSLMLIRQEYLKYKIRKALGI